MKRIVLIITSILCIAFSAVSQTTEGAFIGAISYNVGIPVGSFASDYISKASFYGGDVEGRYFVKEKLSVGVSFSWSKFYEEIPRGTYQLSNGAITATQFRLMRAFPIQATAHYYFGDSESIVRPYAGLGLGAVSFKKETDVSEYAFISNTWNFIATPEVGALIGFGKYANSGLLFVGKNDHTTLSDDQISNLQYLGVQAGIFFGLGE